MSNNLIDVQQMKNVYNTEEQVIKLGLLNIKSLSTKVLSKVKVNVKVSAK